MHTNARRLARAVHWPCAARLIADSEAGRPCPKSSDNVPSSDDALPNSNTTRDETNRDLPDTFAVQDAIAAAVSSAIGSAMHAINQRHFSNRRAMQRSTLATYFPLI
jgi:hypothetical protein